MWWEAILGDASRSTRRCTPDGVGRCVCDVGIEFAAVMRRHTPVRSFGQRRLVDPYFQGAVGYSESTDALEVLLFFVVGQPDERQPSATREQGARAWEVPTHSDGSSRSDTGRRRRQ